MCGRFEAGLTEFDLADYREAIERIAPKVTTAFEPQEAFPSQKLPIITGEGLSQANWGFPLNKKLVINARSETITTKPMFSHAIIKQRCLIPAKSYYEWKHSKVKYQVNMEPMMTMAGLLLDSPQGKRFVIITTEANEQIKAIHHRMPVLLRPEQLSDYLFDTPSALAMLKPYEDQLHLTALSPEQLSLFDFLP